jgi:hypothetical protein
MTRIDLATVLAAPSLPGALCAGQWRLFDLQPWRDPDRPWREQRALELCSTCPVLAACRTYFAALPPSERPFGVIAGAIHRPPTERRPGRPQ